MKLDGKTELGSQSGMKLYLDNRYIISRVFVYAHTKDSESNMGEIGVMIGDSGRTQDKFLQCGNTIKPGP